MSFGPVTDRTDVAKAKPESESADYVGTLLDEARRRLTRAISRLKDAQNLIQTAVSFLGDATTLTTKRAVRQPDLFDRPTHKLPEKAVNARLKASLGKARRRSSRSSTA